MRVRAPLPDPRLAELIVLGPLLRITEHIVGLLDFLELLLRGRVVRVTIGMELLRHGAVGAFDLVLGCGSADA